MKKMFKKAAVAALTAVMTLSSVIASPVTVKADGWEADFSYASADWSVSVWGAADDGSQAAASTTVTGAGTYSMTIDTAAAAAAANLTEGAGAVVFVIDIMAGVDALTAQNYRVSDLKLKVDGNDFAIDTSKIVTGDIEEKGNFRIELYNAYGPTCVSEQYDATVSPFEPSTLTTSQSIDVEFTLVETEDPAYDADGKSIKYVGLASDGNATTGGEEGEADASGDATTFDPAGSYNAYFGLQSPSWTYRDAWNSETTGIGTETWGDYVINNDSGNTYGKVTDAVVSGNGTYTVSLTDIGTVFADEFADNVDGLDKFRILMITTNIPKSDEVKITDVKLIMDGKTVTTYEEAFLDPDDEQYCKILVQNEWNADLKETLPFYNAPTESIEMQFTIEGFAADNPDAQPEVETPAKPAATTAADDAEKDGNNNVVIIVVVVVVIIAVVVVALVLSKKSKKAE